MTKGFVVGTHHRTGDRHHKSETETGFDNQDLIRSARLLGAGALNALGTLNPDPINNTLTGQRAAKTRNGYRRTVSVGPSDIKIKSKRPCNFILKIRAEAFSGFTLLPFA
jgi:hypothetical protein